MRALIGGAQPFMVVIFDYLFILWSVGQGCSNVIAGFAVSD